MVDKASRDEATLVNMDVSYYLFFIIKAEFELVEEGNQKIGVQMTIWCLVTFTLLLILSPACFGMNIAALNQLDQGLLEVC